jgi:hypothetical protein
MKIPFFRQYGDETEFQSKFELLRKLSDIDCSVPARTKGRKSSHRERYCLKIYLMYLSQKELLRFPLKIKKEEAPDFLISCHDETIGLEVTDASTEGYQQAMTDLEKSPPGTVLEMGTNKLMTPGERLIGEGWKGNSVEIEWVDVILDSIIDKTESLNQPHFKTANRHELLIYDNSHLSAMLHVKDALPILRDTVHKKFSAEYFKKNFDCISVIHSSELLYDITKNDFAENLR